VEEAPERNAGRGTRNVARVVSAALGTRAEAASGAHATSPPGREALAPLPKQRAKGKSPGVLTLQDAANAFNVSAMVIFFTVRTARSHISHGEGQRPSSISVLLGGAAVASAATKTHSYPTHGSGTTRPSKGIFIVVGDADA
jgi:hypothetical protein